MGGRDKTCVKVNEVADYIQLRRKRKQGRADINEVDLDMNLRLDSFLPADTTQYYYYQVFSRFGMYFHAMTLYPVQI